MYFDKPLLIVNPRTANSRPVFDKPVTNTINFPPAVDNPPKTRYCVNKILTNRLKNQINGG